MATAQTLTREEKLQLILLHKQQQKRRELSGYNRYFPEEGKLSRHAYPKIMQWFSGGYDYRERLLIAGNRVGKSLAGCYELARHATGEYPHWWTGKRFSHRTQLWTAGKTNQTTRDILQFQLLGEPGKLGTGMIPADMIVDVKAKPGVPNGIELVTIRHISGGTSVLGFKSYEQGIKSFYGTAKDAILLDEEPPFDIYGECLMRTMVTEQSSEGGILFCTMTPLEGWTQFLTSYQENSDKVQPDTFPVRRGQSPNSRLWVETGMDHAPHLSPEAIEDILSKYPPMEQEARRNGIPSMHGGLIYPVEEVNYLIDPFPIPPHFKKVYGMDVGWNWTAAVFLAHDLDQDVVYLYDEYMRSQKEPEIHAAAIKYKYPRNGALNGVIDPHAGDRSSVDGQRLLDIYRRLGLRLIPAENPVNSGIYEVWSRLSTGRLKIFTTLHNWRREVKMYRRNEKGQVIKKDDHIMDATRYGIVSGLKVAKPDPVPEHFLGQGAKIYI